MNTTNGQTLPDNLSLEELNRMMEFGDIQTFVAACKSLRNAKTREAYGLLKQHIDHKDLYKRRCVLGVIFDYPEAAELISHLEHALESEKSFLVGTALGVIITGKARVSDEAVLTCLERNLHAMNRYSCYALDFVEKTQSNEQQIMKMYHASKNDSIRIGLAECLHSFCTQENHMAFYELFRNDPVSHIRILACRVAKEYNHPELLQEFFKDKDGHIRKLALSE